MDELHDNPYHAGTNHRLNLVSLLWKDPHEEREGSETQARYSSFAQWATVKSCVWTLGLIYHTVW